MTADGSRGFRLLLLPTGTLQAPPGRDAAVRAGPMIMMTVGGRLFRPKEAGSLAAFRRHHRHLTTAHDRLARTRPGSVRDGRLRPAAVPIPEAWLGLSEVERISEQKASVVLGQRL